MPKICGSRSYRFPIKLLDGVSRWHSNEVLLHKLSIIDASSFSARIPHSSTINQRLDDDDDFCIITGIDDA